MSNLNLVPGMYQSDEPFGSKLKNFIIEGKWCEVPNTNPGPGYYEVERAEKLTKARSRSPAVAKSPAR
jgi:hypothetical protein